MTTITRKFLQITLAAATGFGCLFVNENVALTGPHSLVSISLVSTAEARIGRPLTPMSYAGVARRTTRRAVAVGVAAGAAAATCVQRVDAYGRVYTVC
jgi:hypothetical protein